jgi:hypothetical protein
MTEMVIQLWMAEVAKFIALYRDSENLEERYAAEAARGTMADLERTLGTLPNRLGHGPMPSE